MGVSSDSSGESVVTKQDEVNALTFICLNHISSYSPTCSTNLVEEVDGVLHLYGIGSLDTLYSPPATWQPVQIGFHCIEYDEILSLLGKLASRYSQLKVVIFDSCNLCYFDQLDRMTVIPSVDTLVVSLDGNPITSLSLWQHYAIVKLNLISLNNNTVRRGMLVTKLMSLASISH